MPNAMMRLAAATCAAVLMALPVPAAENGTKPSRVAALDNPATLGVAYTISFWGVPFGHTDF